MGKHMLMFDVTRPGDQALIDLAFNKKKADDRKEWLREFKVGRPIDRASPAWAELFRRGCADSLLPRAFLPAWNVPRPINQDHTLRGLHQQRTDPLLDGRQCPLDSLGRRWPQAGTEESAFRMLSQEA